jgi:mercuric ion binding protein
MRISTFTFALLLSGSAFAGTSKTLTLDVKNMSCPACPITVKKALEKNPGVGDVKIDFDYKTATMRLDAEKADVAILTKATMDTGFPSALRK